MLVQKDLDYYKNLDYRIIIELVTDEYGKEYMAYSHELGKYSCYGTGKTKADAIDNYQVEKDEFIEYLFENNKPIPEPTIEQVEPFGNHNN